MMARGTFPKIAQKTEEILAGFTRRCVDRRQTAWPGSDKIKHKICRKSEPLFSDYFAI
jgi:hypothetical protein